MADARAGITLSEARRQYLDQRRASQGDGRAEEDSGIVLDFLVDFLGDRTLASLTEKDFMRVENALPHIPHPRGVPHPHDGSLYLRWRYTEEHGWEGLKWISPTRLKNGWYRSLHAFFDCPGKKGIYNGPNYTFDLVHADNAEEKERDAWHPDEIIKLFSLPLFTGCQSAAWHWEPDCGSLLIGTKRIVGRVAASAIASASRSSFVFAFTYGRTYSGDIRRIV